MIKRDKSNLLFGGDFTCLPFPSVLFFLKKADDFFVNNFSDHAGFTSTRGEIASTFTSLSLSFSLAVFERVLR